MDTRWFLVGDFLQIIGHDDTGDGPFGLGDPDSPIYKMTHLRGHRGHVNVLTGDVLKERNQVDFLLVIAAHCRPGLLPYNRDHALVVHFSIVQSVEQMDGARSTSAPSQ